MTENEMKIKRYDVALATRNFEIELFWKRSLFFWGFIASSFIAYASLLKDDSSLAVLIACLGFVCSIAWSLVNRGSKYWQENWESIVDDIEDDITKSLFKERGKPRSNGFWLSARTFSVSKVTIALSDFTVIIWFSLLIYHLNKSICLLNISSSCVTIAAIIFSFIFVGIMTCCSRSSNAKKP